MRSTLVRPLFTAGMLALLVQPVLAESNVQTGAATLAPGATARVDFTIVVPKILYLRVGTGSSYTTGALSNIGTVDLVTFTPTAAQLGNGTAVAGTGGNLGAGVETAAVISNSGNVTLNAAASATGLSNGAGDFINFNQITTTAAALTAGYTLLNAPTLANGASSTTVVLTAPATKTIRADAQWTFRFANTVVPPTGTYGGVNVNGGRVIYTATMP